MPSALELLRTLVDAARERGVAADEAQSIAHGAQVRLRLGAESGVLRAYEGKKGLRLDLSQLKEGELKRIIEDSGRSGRKPAPAKARVAMPASAPASSTSRIGTDESGKGDYFGPLVVAAVYLPAERAQEILGWGVQDSKNLSDSAARRLAEQITETLPVGLWLLDPPAYNEKREAIGNLNLVLAEGHADAIRQLLDKGQVPTDILTDKFGDERLVANALKTALGKERAATVKLRQAVRAESDPAVAAASIVARSIFLDALDELSDRFEVPLHKGAGSPVDKAGRAFVRRHGAEALRHVAKLHFKNTQKILR